MFGVEFFVFFFKTQYTQPFCKQIVCVLVSDMSKANPCNTFADSCVLVSDMSKPNPCNTFADSCVLVSDMSKPNPCNTFADNCVLVSDMSKPNPCNPLQTTESTSEVTAPHSCTDSQTKYTARFPATFSSP